MAEMYLVLIETSGNQNYIFSTNKLKENIGASELTYRAGTKWVLEAVDQVRSASEQSLQLGRLVDEDEKTLTSKEIRIKLLDFDENRPIESSDDVKVEVVIATSGKALLLTKDKEVAKDIIRYVTHKATRFAPGLDISGVISEPFEWQSTWANKQEPQGIAKANKWVHREFEVLRSQKPSPALRFLQLPIVAQCTTSGLPASQVDSDGKPISTVAQSKRATAEQGLERITRLLKDNGCSTRLFATVNALQKKFDRELDWLAVIHADGNGLGEIFLNFEKYTCGDREYVDKYRSFSIALEICTERAFLESLNAIKPIQNTKNRKQLDTTLEIPLVPLILGGDDLTVICDGKCALPFVHHFLQRLETWTAGEIPEAIANLKEYKQIIPEIAEKALKTRRLSACAGISITKPHFPTSMGYVLAEKLMKSAKQVKERIFTPDDTNPQKLIPYPCSALDFHVLYDSSAVELARIRDRLKRKENGSEVYLVNRPYIVTPQSDLALAIKGADWAEFHRWETLKENVQTLVAKDEENRRKLPSSQMHELRAGLFLGKREQADARYLLIRDRYSSSNSDDKDIRVFEGNPDSLFQQEPESGIYMTRLLDAIDAADFLGIEG
ncbi:hypothetical protein [Leptolyngbya sp. FACHB-711]|uniref:hypothetical protein n=1 Tax=Leptolyngbya sp. FACHB-711 TaxID=2692813 RepID=UPI0016830CB5|nr:hypothetical protein [Leptolyngbya sp. FACHB-711]MBD2023922.1 hypothetical protein [Leptolyngbya sp. FACHB-711]